MTFMEELEKWLKNVKRLAYESKAFTYGMCALVVMVGVAFPVFLLWVAATTIVFVFVKGVLLILEMIKNK